MRFRDDGRKPPHARKRPLHRPSTRRWKLPALLDAIRELIECKGERGSSAGEIETFTLAEVAEKLRAKPGLVHQCFHKLNLEGLLEQGNNGLPHDIYRGPPNHHSGWVATTYRRIRGTP